MSVERAERVNEANVAQGFGWSRAAPREAPEIDRRLGAMQRHFVVRDNGRQRLSFARRVGKPKLMLIAPSSKDEMFAVTRALALAQVWPVRGRKSQLAGVGWADDKNDRAGARFWKP